MKSWKLNYGAVLAAQTLGMVGFSMSMPIIPLFLADDIGISDPKALKLWVGVIQSCGSITLAFFAPIWGHLADVYSRRAMLLRAMAGGAVIVPLMALVKQPYQLLILRALQGCLTGTVAAATVLTIGIVPPASLPLALGLLQTGLAAGGSLGPLAGGLTTDFLGHRAAFLGTGICLAIAAVIVFFCVKELQDKEAAKVEKKSIFPDFKIILSSPIVLSLILVSFAIQVSNTTANPIMPLFLKELCEGTKYQSYLGSATGIVLGAGAMSTAAAALLSGKFSRWIGFRRTLIFCLAAGCLSIIPQAFSQNLLQLTIMHIVASFLVGGAVPVLQAMLATNCERGIQGSVFGVNSAITSTGAAIGPLIGSAAAMISYRAVFPITALILGACSLKLITGRKK